MLVALVATQPRRGVMSFLRPLCITRVVNPTNVLPTRSVNAARFASTEQQKESYSSMKVSELRELLRARGLAVSEKGRRFALF